MVLASQVREGRQERMRTILALQAAFKFTSTFKLPVLCCICFGQCKNISVFRCEHCMYYLGLDFAHSMLFSKQVLYISIRLVATPPE